MICEFDICSIFLLNQYFIKQLIQLGKWEAGLRVQNSLLETKMLKSNQGFDWNTEEQNPMLWNKLRPLKIHMLKLQLPMRWYLMFGDWLLGRSLNLNEVLRMGSSWWDYCSLSKRNSHQRALCMHIKEEVI